MRVRVLHHNVRHWGDSRHSLVSAFRELDPDVITINSHGSGENLRVWGYSVVTQVSGVHDGWAIAVRRSLSCRMLELSRDGMLAVQLQTEDGPLVIATFYRPPRRDWLPVGDLLALANRAEPVYLFADLNARHGFFGHANRNRAGEVLVDLVHRGKFEWLGPFFPTWRGGRGRSGRPDVVFANGRVFHHHRIWDGGPTASDHTMVVCDLSAAPISVPVRERHCMRRADWEGYDRDLDNTEWKYLSDDCTRDDVDESVEELLTKLRLAKERWVPKIRARALPGPRVSGAVKLARFRLRNTVRAYDGGYATHANVVERQRTLRDVARVEYARAWEEKVSELANARNTDPQKFWKDIRRMRGEGARCSNERILDEHGRRLESDGDVCDAFTRRLERVFRISPEENANFDRENEERVVEFMRENRHRHTPRARAGLGDLPRLGLGAGFSSGEVRRAIGSFKERAPGESGVTSSMLKKLPDSVVANLARLFSACLSLGYFPDGLKTSVVKMIPKKETAARVEEFRPIALLETVGKVFERLINDRLTVHMELHGLYYDYQFGFRKGKGTCMAIATAYEWFARARAQNCQTYAVLRDVSKAFDKVWHLGLKYKILHLGVDERVERLLCSYLDGRRACVSRGGVVGRIFGLEAGVPQGGVLSPSLYNVFTRDTPHAGADSINIGYADDVTQCVVYWGRSRAMGGRRLEREVRTQLEFERRWKISTNPGKLKAMHVGMRGAPPLVVDGTRIDWVPNAKMLGWEFGVFSSITGRRQRRARAFNVLASLRRFGALRWKVKRQLYYSLVRPVLEYPVVPLHLLARAPMLGLQRVQNSAVRWMLGVGRREGYTSEDLHRRAGVEPLNRYLHKRAESVWRAIRRHFPELYRELQMPLRRGREKALCPRSLARGAPVPGIFN